MEFNSTHITNPNLLHT
jgi:hypothetical protein